MYSRYVSTVYTGSEKTKDPIQSFSRYYKNKSPTLTKMITELRPILN